MYIHYYINYPITSNALRHALDATRAPRQTPAPQKVNIKRHGRAESRWEPFVSLKDQNNRSFKSSFLGKELYTAITCQSKNKKDQKVLHLLLHKAALPSLFARSCLIAIYESKHWYKDAWSNRWTAEVPRHLLGVPFTLSSPRLSWAPFNWSL